MEAIEHCKVMQLITQVAELTEQVAALIWLKDKTPNCFSCNGKGHLQWNVLTNIRINRLGFRCGGAGHLKNCRMQGNDQQASRGRPQGLLAVGPDNTKLSLSILRIYVAAVRAIAAVITGLWNGNHVRFRVSCVSLVRKDMIVVDS